VSAASTNQIIVGISDCHISDNPQSVLATHALGSCIAVVIHDPVAAVGGMLHFMLPESSLDREKAQQNPFMFADTGIPLLFRGTFERGADRKRLVVQLAGGAQMMDEAGVFNIGKRNYLAAKKLLWKNGFMTKAEAVGGTVSRTVRLEVGSGRLWMRETGGGEHQLGEPRAPAKGEANGL
jgi:chemotaxis protein CheD